MDSEIVEIYLPAVLGYEKVARGAAETIAKRMEFSPDRIEDLKTAVAEACMNAIEHGNNLDRTTSVTVLLKAAPSKLEIQVADLGRHALSEPLPEPGQGDMRGWGLFFIQQLMDEVEITHLPEGGNQVRMVIYLTPSPDDAGVLLEPDVFPNQIKPASAARPIQPAAPGPAAIQPAQEPPDAISAAEAAHPPES